MANRRKKRAAAREVSTERNSSNLITEDTVKRFLRWQNLSRREIMEHRMICIGYFLLGMKVFLTAMVFDFGIYSYLVAGIGFLLVLNGMIHMEILRMCRYPRVEIAVLGTLYLGLHVLWLVKDSRRFLLFPILGGVLVAIGIATPLLDLIEGADEERKRKHWTRRHKKKNGG